MAKNLSRCLRKLLNNKQELLQALDKYECEWGVYLEYLTDKTEYLNFKEYFTEIQNQCNVVLGKISQDIFEYKTTGVLTSSEIEIVEDNFRVIKSNILVKLNEILVKLKEKESEMLIFRQQVDLNKILTEDSVYIKEMRYQEAKENLKKHLESLERPMLPSKLTIVSLNNHLYYIKKVVLHTEKSVMLYKEMDDVGLGFDSEIIRQWKTHLYFMLSHSSVDEDVLEYYKDNKEFYEKKFQELLDLHDRIGVSVLSE